MSTTTLDKINAFNGEICSKNLFDTIDSNATTIESTLNDHANKIGDLTSNGITETDLATAIKNDRSQLLDMVCNVKNFGAKGDGVTDDSQSFQNAINYIYSINPLGGTLFIPAGIYCFNNSLNPYNNQNFDYYGNKTDDTYYANGNGAIACIKFQGVGKNRTFLKLNNGTEIIKAYNTNPIAYYDLACYDLRFVGVDNKNTSINLDNSNATSRTLEFKNVDFNNFDIGFIYDKTKIGNLGDQSRLIMHNCNFGYNNIGAEFGGDDSDIFQCRFERNNKWGFVIINGSRMSFINNKIQYNGGSATGILSGQYKLLGNISDVTFRENYIENKASSSTGNEDSTFFYIDYNATYGNTYIYNLNIENNYFNAWTGKSLMECTNSANIYLKGVNIKNNKIYGFKLNTNKELLIIPSNVAGINGLYCNGNTYDNILDSTGMVISDYIMTANQKGLRNNGNCDNPIITTPYMNTLGGAVTMIAGSVNYNATQKYFGSELFTVIRNSVGNYTITLTKTNKSTAQGNSTYFPIVITPTGATGKIINANVIPISENSFQVCLYDETKASWDIAFHFMCLITAV